MSVFAGVIHCDGCPIDSGHVAAVLKTYADLGSDGRRAWSHGHVALLHWMRHSTPQSLHEVLPNAIQDDSLAITAEARLDNRDELCRALSVSEPDQATIPDSVLILLAYRRWGENCPEHLEGDFSFAIFDRRKQTLVCVQSAFPTQPLYYLATGRSFAFASLIRPLLVLARAPKQLNERHFARFAAVAQMRNDFDPDDRGETAFAGVKALPPATTLTVTADGSVLLRTWWRPDPNREIRLSHDGDYYDQVRELTVRSVHDRMRSHRPVVCCLSGGLDSSVIACVAARKLRERGHRLTALSSILPLDHPGPEQDEREFIDIVKHAEDLDVQYLHPRQSMTDDETRYLDCLEKPGFSFKSYVLRAFHEAAASRGAGVILDGCFGEIGPSNHALGLLPYLARHGQWKVLGRELQAMSRLTGRSAIRLLLQQVVAPHFPALTTMHRRVKNAACSARMISLPLNEEFARRHGFDRSIQFNGALLKPELDPKRSLALAIEAVQSGGMAMNQGSLAYGMRTWFPFFDRRVIDICLAVPARLYQVDGIKRNLIRQAMQGILPPRIQWRQTKGPFSPDYYRRFQNERLAIREEFASLPATDIAHDYYDIGQVIRTIDLLADRPGDETTPEGEQFKLCIQASLAGIRFLHWFDRVNVDAVPVRRVA